MELVFVNQVRGISIGNNPILDNTRNCSDGKIQRSSSRPDIFFPKIQSIAGNQEREHFNFDSITIKGYNVPFFSTYISNEKRDTDLKLMQKLELMLQNPFIDGTNDITSLSETTILVLSLLSPRRINCQKIKAIKNYSIGIKRQIHCPL